MLQQTGTADSSDLRIWGKSRGLDGRYPLVCHLLDTAAAARVLWDAHLAPGVRDRIAEGMGVPVGRARALTGHWAGLHDIGKASPVFQSADPAADLAGYPPGDGVQARHDLVTHRWLQAALPDLGYDCAGSPASPAFLAAQIAGGHHGVFHPPARDLAPGWPLGCFGFEADAWEQERRTALTLTGQLLGDPGPPPGLTVPAAALVSAVIILADWLVSSEEHLRVRMTDLPADGSLAGLRRHYARSLDVAARLVREAGLERLTLRTAGFAEAFPHITVPNALQVSLLEQLPALVSGPGLLLVMAPPGTGKTEAGLHAAEQMGEAAGRPGLYVALPTTATADQMHARVAAWARRRCRGPAPLMLLHSMAWLTAQDTADGGRRFAVGGEDPLAPADWLLGGKRGMFAPWSVGTIDQALMGVLRAKYSTLRLAGLAGKTVVIDEVHAADPYMQGLLLQLLRWLGTLGTPVVLLSATLQAAAARQLLAAYLEDTAGRREAARLAGEATIGYPGWVYADAAARTVTSVPVELPPRPPLTTALRTIRLRAGEGDVPRPDRGPVLRAELAPLAEAGGCAMVLCMTVAEAQDTYRQLGRWLTRRGSGRAVQLDLLHARFPAWQRAEITGRVMASYAAGGDRPPAGILVATAIAEQSLDLDLDLVISDLAPVSLLLQRAGRCWRHPATARPAWSDGPRLVVLVPPGTPAAPAVFPTWRLVHDEDLLVATARQIAARPVIAIPADVQGLVDAVCTDPALITGVEDAAAARLGEEAALRELSRLVAIPAPRDMDNLYELTSSDADPELLATRFGADTIAVLPVFTGADGQLWLDRACTAVLPGTGGRPPGRDATWTIVMHTVPVRAGTWLSARRPENEPPPSWQRSIHLRRLVLLPHKVRSDGTIAPAVVGDRVFLLDPVTGLHTTRTPGGL